MVTMILVGLHRGRSSHQGLAVLDSRSPQLLLELFDQALLGPTASGLVNDLPHKLDERIGNNILGRVFPAQIGEVLLSYNVIPDVKKLYNSIVITNLNRFSCCHAHPSCHALDP